MSTWGVEKGYSNPVEFMEIDDLSRFTPTIKIILDLFNNHNARAVFILNEEKFIPFKVFAKKFLALTKDDGKIYDFIGTNRYGNSWAESMAQLAQRRNKWNDKCITSIDSGKLFYNIQMITYNLFRERKFKIDDEKVWMTPF
jgi:hypothetical protein